MAQQWPPKRATAFIWVFPIRDATGALVTGVAGLDSEISKDGGAFADCTNEATEIGTTGWYSLTLTGAEMTADYVNISVKSTLYPPVGCFILTTESTWDEGIDVNAASVRTAVGLAAANLDTQLSTIDDFLDTEIAAIKAKTDNLPSDPADESLLEAAITAAQVAIIDGVLDGIRLRKNTAFSAFPFKMVDSTDHVTAETGLTITATRSIDGAAFAACANTATEISLGWYKIDLAAADLNGDVIVLRFTGTGADIREIVVFTQPTD